MCKCDTAFAEDPELQKPVRFSFNKHAYPNKPRPVIVPANGRKEAAVPLKRLQEHLDGKKDDMEDEEKQQRQTKAWQSILRARVKKNAARRKKRGWDNLCAPAASARFCVLLAC